VLAVFFLVLFLLCAGIVVLIAADLSAPLRDLERRAGEMARGDLQRPVVTGAEADEVGRLAFAMDAMRRSLKEQISTVEELNVSLEEKVSERTSALALANADLREALGSLTRAQDQLVRSEKLASMGQLVAGVAHELNNPINAVGNTLEPLERILDSLVRQCATRSSADGEAATAILEDVQAMLRVIRNGTSRIQRIVTSLSSYVRTDGEPTENVDLNRLVDETLEIAGHMLADVLVKKDLSRLPPVKGDPSQLGQILMNLMANAAQAMAGAPERLLRVVSRVEEGWIDLIVSDSGPGVPEGQRSRIFDPFYTTKPVGQGTGLGLSISQEIAARHGGSLELLDSPEGGASFRLRLPRAEAARPNSHGPAVTDAPR
jgi:C4-dicarboxylate-specific signal transduction histidine kinase